MGATLAPVLLILKCMAIDLQKIYNFHSSIFSVECKNNTVAA
jgi:hypothetical protein